MKLQLLIFLQLILTVLGSVTPGVTVPTIPCINCGGYCCVECKNNNPDDNVCIGRNHFLRNFK